LWEEAMVHVEDIAITKDKIYQVVAIAGGSGFI
jgi:hypothetical protein